MQQSISSLWLQKLYLDLMEVRNVKYKNFIMVRLKSNSQKKKFEKKIEVLENFAFGEVDLRPTFIIKYNVNSFLKI